ncbi:creatininase family protein [Brachybacterium fresconis]|uniref:Creatinine amidohydrolase n=1 Tax=Brachybacterium fresconis TaxID=173363 RepID=A0ABS4YMZ6_9MICO|nr:creatininase family protein [Brachybacterium fresconis]MBP2410166.1 creatinine amidohydrolase [Brachybacterium fresconis]
MTRLTSLRRQDVAELAPRSVAVLPIGSLEQHGEHLPLGTDSLLVEAVVDRALGEREDAVLCPTLPYGFSGHHQFAVALSLPPRTLLDVLSALLDSLVAAGFRRILVVNGHGGNIEMMSQAVKLAALEHPILAACCSYWQLVTNTSGGPGHAGRFETDLMSAAHPALVGPDGHGPTELPLFDQELVPGLHLERHGEWPRTGGVTDPPGDGDPTRGEATLTEAAAALEACLDALLTSALPPEADTSERAAGTPEDTAGARSGAAPPDRTFGNPQRAAGTPDEGETA